MTTPGARGEPLPPSSILQNRYRILRLHDQGGSATVYLAERLGVDERVPLAVKELNPDAFGLAEFKNEVNVLYSLNHPNLPKVYDFFEEDGRHYLVMDFVQGRTLKQRVLENGPLPVDQALGYALQVCAIMSYLHERAERKIIHRDLKPSNLMVTRGGSVKLLDFGIARVPEAKLPGNRLHAYTEDYASPEQKANRKTDERSDIYSFGVTLYFLLTGTTPSETPGASLLTGSVAGDRAAETAGETTAAAVGSGQPGPAAGLVAKARLPRDVRRIIARCLRPNPSDRYQSFTELARDIQACRRARRTRLARAAWGAVSVLAVAAVLLAVKLIWRPSLYPVVGPDRIVAGGSLALQVGLPAAWNGSLDSIVWMVEDTQVLGRTAEAQRGRYLAFSSTDLGVYNIQAYVEQEGRLRPLSEVKRVEVYPTLLVPGQILVGQPIPFRTFGATAGGGREYTFTWTVKTASPSASGSSSGAADTVFQATTAEPTCPVTLPGEGTYVVQVLATVKSPKGLEVSVAGDPVTVRGVTRVAVDSARVVNVNGSFDQEYGSQPVGWTLIFQEHLVYDRGQGRSDSRSIRFTPWTKTPSSYAVEWTELAPSKVYRVTAWAKGEGLGAGSALTVAASFRSRVDETFVLPEESVTLEPTGTFDWRQVMLYFRIPPGDPVNLELYLRYSGSGTIWFDDCFVEEVG